MLTPSADHSARKGWLEILRKERGAVLATVAVSMVAIFGISGLALDSARGYVARAQLSRAVDATALTTAGALRMGEDEAEARGRAIARANGVDPNTGGETLDLTFGNNAEGERTVLVEATRVVQMTFMRVLGWDQITVASAAEATVPPLDLVLVLDQSGSLSAMGAWDDLQQAAKDFSDYFDEILDQMGLVSFQIRGTERFMLAQPFQSSIGGAIDAMSSAGDTNAGEGLRLAKWQLDNGPVRNRSIRVVVFFTDGRPTGFRGSVGGQDRIMAVYTTHNGGKMRGYFNNPNSLPTDTQASPSGCANATACLGWTEPTIRDRARESGLERAAEIRSDDVYIFAIGLGNPAASDPILVPDMDYLRLIANEGGISDAGQPQGRAYFAPSSAELDEVFDAVAQDIIVRLTQ